ncbi:PTS sugar transporter subunit IIA [Myxococcus sp. CA051A]|uniref:PTS sugar transporter subunit IIA n=1 Tax=Myxococcus llanfairpwllgwyngyllgogerychwyrndrobwllllantysiliogogogochensis TaxID=2590453 RepID=A0A540WRU8_9BACT|nr:MULTISPECIES: PTS sugar transporter subunit IIA [Myxococcus]MCP3168415.1 PTS sugar transporter subunit IIA [Myxococcus qinghaiensis]NTX03236.1 PTS sugar transporter subunit IIA [Myxococcus sp. CA040A]NTX11649.1 PTS sugar transporter subunit IIA [Myxococcus sp. CA056]NTX34254.1 PTS sugar transporter subunit IIA [Myxococcus sp. CA033]NTX56190.1 PTS sugar transporter subunit IIA [Myxococcus sp. CA039A]
MVGLVVASHGRLAEELVSTAEQIVGKLPAVATCNIEPGTPVEDIRAKMKQAVSRVDTGDGVIILADLFGGTPCKESLMMCQRMNLEVLAGVNLPMLLKANSLRSEQLTLPEMANQLASHGQRNITCASALLREAQQQPRT